MNLQFFNTPKPENFDSSKLPEVPAFVTYKPDFHLLEQYSRAYDSYKDIVVIAHGGSINPFMAFYYPLKYQAKKRVHFLNTTDPDYIYDLKKELEPKSTLVIATSKSGETTTQIEALMQFVNYPLLIITAKDSPLRAIGEKLGAKIVEHPPIGGRYTGFTEVNLLPAAIAGLDVQGLYAGAKKFFDVYSSDNLAWKAASVFWQLEQKGYVDVFMPFYTHYLFPASAVVVQLNHESFGKGGKGQTYFAHEAPESQHHTNQRFFGGMKNIAGFFVGCDSFNHPTTNVLPTNVHSISMKGHHLHDIDKIPLEKSMEFELLGTLEDARANAIPLAHLSIASFSPEEIGSFQAFWELYAVYSSLLRGVNPFDQPQVEASKILSFNKRLQFKGLL